MKVVDVQIRVDNDPRSERTGRVEALRLIPWAAVHGRTRRHVIAQRVAEDDVVDLVWGDVFGEGLDDDCEFALVDDVIAPTGQDDRVVGTDDGCIHLEEDRRHRLGLGAARGADLVSEVRADADDLICVLNRLTVQCS